MAADAKMTALSENVIAKIKDLFPHFRTSKRSLVLVGDPWVEDSLDPGDIAGQLTAKHNEQTWGVPVKAKVGLVDNITGAYIAKPREMTLMKLPRLTNRFSFIVDGGEYQVDHLLRLKSGIYTRVRGDGTISAEFNLKKGGHKNFELELDRKTSVIEFTPKSGGAHVPVYPLFRVMGVSDEEMEKAWGPQVFKANKLDEQASHRALQKFYEKTRGPDLERPLTQDDLHQHVFRYFNETELYPDTTKATLGQAFNKVSGGALLASSNKLLKLERKEVLPDDRDSLIFKEAVHFEDFIPDRLQKSNKQILNKVLMTLNHKESPSEILGGGEVFNRHIREFFTKGGNVSERGEQTNPVQMISSNFKTTLVAKDYGGIKDTETLRDEMRAVNPSHFGFLDPMHTPESERTGVTLHLGSGVQKNGTNLETQVYDLKSGKFRYVPVAEFHQAMVVLPDHVKWVDGKPVPIAEHVKVKMPGGEIAKRPFKSADFLLPSAKSMFSYASNLIPFLPTDQGNRASMADKQLEQAISLKHREAPLVRSLLRPSEKYTFEDHIGRNFAAHRAPVDGRVSKIDWDAIHISDGKHEHVVQKYDHFPLNDPTTMLHSVATVKPGDVVKKGQIIADTNFSKDGVLALGTNLRVGYIPFKGYNFEDGIVISETASKKLTSEHLHKLALDIDTDVDKTSKGAWKVRASRKAANLTKEQWAALDDDGVIKPGSKVTKGQVLATCLTPNLQTSSIMKEAFGTKAIKPWKDKSLTWDEDFVGTVERVVKSPNGKSVKVFVKTEQPAEIGDKLAGRHGNKGIITRILPDGEMPFTKHGDETRPLEVLLNPSGVPTRMNVGQVLETAAGKIAEKTGQPFLVNNFAGANHDYRKQVTDELKKHGLTDEELVYDPSDTRKPLGSVLVGPQHILKLKHQVEKKLVVRGGGSDLYDNPLPYDKDMQPTKGGAKGGQGFGALEMYSLLGHNARHNIREMSTYKSDMQSEDFWRLIREGYEPPAPKVPFSYQKFEGLLKGLGVDVRKEGTNVRMTPMTDAEVRRLAGNREITEPKLFFGRTTKPEKNGLFDPELTGVAGDKWSMIRLSEPLPNPLFVGGPQNKGPVPAVLSTKFGDISTEFIDQVVAGKKSLNGITGGKAIGEALKQIDVEKAIKDLRSQLASKKGGAKRDPINRTLKYLLALKELGLKPHEAYMVQSVPVLPPMFRPAAETQRGDIAKSPLNDLYKNVITINNQVKKAGEKGMKLDEYFGSDIARDLRGDLWNGLKALQATGHYLPVFDKDAHDQRELSGIVDLIGTGGAEGQPKEGFFQSRLVKRKQDLSIRSTIVPEPTLHIDEVGLPEHAAMELYKPFVVAHLYRRYGYRPDEALKEMQTAPRSEIAKKALSEVMADRPLILKRDPALHKFNVMAFKPKIVEGKAIKIHPLVTGGFNADFDGDTMAGTIPVSREAVDEAKRMFPTKNLFSSTSYKPMHVPNQEFLLGLHLASKWGKETGKKFATIADAKKAYERGQVGLTDVVHVGTFKTTPGRAMIVQGLPGTSAFVTKILKEPEFVIEKGTLSKVVEDLARNHETHFDQAVNHLKDLGTEQSFRTGFSFGLKDFAPLPERDRILAEAHKKAEHVHANTKHPWERDDQLVEIYAEATKKIEDAAKARFADGHNRLATMVYSKARGKPEQLRQMIAAPMLVQDSSGRTLPTPVTRSYGEGLDVGDYWLSQHGARKGTLQRASGTRDPGSMTKDIINSTIATVIVSEDCKTKNGISMPLDHEDIHDRFLAQEYGQHKAGTLITPAVVTSLKKLLGPKKAIQVRSPLKCQHGEGLCAKCYGLNENGQLHAVGTNIGILAGQALGEPATQLAMDAFHTGGVASARGGGSVSKIQRLKDLLKMPKTLPGAAVLAKVEGTITSIKPNAGLGGHDVVVNGVSHHVREGELGDIRPGMQVQRGDSLSWKKARIHPKELLHITKDMNQVQRYLTDELYEGLYKGEDVKKRNVEMVVRALTNYTRVKDPGSSHWEVGDVVPHSVVEEHNRGLKGTKQKPVVHEPVLEGSGQIPRFSTDWMARLNYQRLGETVQRAAGMAWKSDIHGMHPIPGIAYGAEFGKPPPTKKGYNY